MAQAEVAASALASAALASALASALAAADEAEKERAGEQEMPLFLAGDQLQQSRMRFVLRRWRWNITNRPLPSTALLTAQGGRMFWESLSARPLRRVLTYWHCESERRFASAQLLSGAEAVRICSVLIRWREGAHNHALQLLGAYFGDIYADRVGARLRAIRQWQAFALDAARLKVAAFANATRSFRRSWLPQRGETLDDEPPWLLEAANMEPSIGHASLAIACLDSTADSCEAQASLSSDANAGRALQPNLEVLSAPAELSYQTSVAMTVGGTVAAFDQIMFTACLARVLNIAASQIALEIWSGSVHVKSTIASRTPHAAAAVVTTLEAHTPDSLSASLAAAASLLNFGGAEDASAAADGTSGADGAHGGGGMFDVLELGPPAPVVEFMPAANCLTDQGATPRAASDGSGEGRDGLSTARTALDGDIDTATPEVSSDRWVHSRLAAGASGNYSPPNLALWTGDTTAAAADAEAVMSIALAHRAAGRSSTCDDKTVSAPASPTVECRHPPVPRTVTTLAAVPAAAIPTLVTTAHGDSAHDYGSDSGGDGGSSCARIGSSYDGGGATWTCTVSEGDAPTCAAVAGLGHTLQPPPAALPYSAEIRSLQEETVLTQPSVPQQPRCEAGGTSGSGTCGATSDDGPDALYSPPPRVRQALGGPPPMARGVAVSAVPAPPLVSSTAHPVAVAALSAPGVQIVQLTERPDGATQLII
eukprot:jgi/Chrpa1/4727/Chrysochromulina_OHIO_Genome00014739-RA